MKAKFKRPDGSTIVLTLRSNAVSIAKLLFDRYNFKLMS
jgi:hypothetical protein